MSARSILSEAIVARSSATSSDASRLDADRDVPVEDHHRKGSHDRPGWQREMPRARPRVRGTGCRAPAPPRLPRRRAARPRRTRRASGQATSSSTPRRHGLPPRRGRRNDRRARHLRAGRSRRGAHRRRPPQLGTHPAAVRRCGGPETKRRRRAPSLRTAAATASTSRVAAAGASCGELVHQLGVLPNRACTGEGLTGGVVVSGAPARLPTIRRWRDTPRRNIGWRSFAPLRRAARARGSANSSVPRPGTAPLPGRSSPGRAAQRRHRRGPRRTRSIPRRTGRARVPTESRRANAMRSPDASLPGVRRGVPTTQALNRTSRRSHASRKRSTSWLRSGSASDSGTTAPYRERWGST